MLEAMIVIAVFLLMVTASAPPIVSLLLSNDMEVARQELIHVLRQANERASTQVYDSSWGVYLDTTADQYTLFSGDSYATRNTALDVLYALPNSIDFGSIDLTGGGTEVIFDQITGATSQDGSIELNSPQESPLNILINPIGNVY